jgi:ATP/maltotriose-dependent transcriptional regulator MalT
MELKDFNQAHSNIVEFLKFANQYNLLHFKFEAELLHSQIYIELGDTSQAMI